MAAGGTLRINGNLALSAGSQIYICSCAQTLVTGTATLNGATLVVPLATFQAQNYTFLTALGGCERHLLAGPHFASGQRPLRHQ